MKKENPFKRYLLTINGAPRAAFVSLEAAKQSIQMGRGLGLAIIWDVITGETLYTFIDL